MPNSKGLFDLHHHHRLKMVAELGDVPQTLEVRIRAHPDRSPGPKRNRITMPRLLLLFLLSVIFPDTGAKEAVIFEQFGQLTGVTAYLHVHVELSISSVEAQLEKYRQLLKENCDSEMAILNYMLTYANTSISNFTLRKETLDHPGGLSEKSMICQNTKLWYKVAQLHLRDLEDMEESVATLRKSLPVIPNRNTGRIPVKAQFAPPEGSHIINMQAYVDTHDHLLTLIPEKSYTSRNTNSPMTVETGELRNITKTTSGSTLQRNGVSLGRHAGLNETTAPSSSGAKPGHRPVRSHLLSPSCRRNWTK